MRQFSWLLVGLTLGCTARRTTGGPGDDGGGNDPAIEINVDVGTDPTQDPGPDVDTDAPTDGSVYDTTPDTGCTIPGSGMICVDPRPELCVGAETCDDGLDNNCNGEVDEVCGCIPGQVQPCFLGPPGRRGTGGCTDGTQRCVGSGEFGTWGACTGGISPGAEVCDNLDNDCNGCVDDPLCCTPEIDCPGPGDPRIPDGQPFTDYPIRGSDFYSGPAASWRWDVRGAPCDDLYVSLGQPPSFTVTGATTADPVIHFTLSGDYTVTMTVTTPSGSTLTCTWVVHVVAPGLRVELCWDIIADIDLHLHRSGTTTNWFSATGTDTNNDDCYYANCAAGSYWSVFGPPPGADWGYPSGPLTECSGTPEGMIWGFVGSCHNPRLDIDNISAGYFPENINLDNPNEGDRFRVMVHYYGNTGVTYPLVNIYCGGSLVATYGAAPDLVAGFTMGAGWNAGTMWRVVDVTTHTPAGLPVNCDVAGLHPPGSLSGYWVTENNSTY